MKIIPFIIKFPIFKRIIPSLLRKAFIVLKNEIFKIKFKGINLEINIRDPLDREIFFTQEYEKKQFEELEKIINLNNVKIFMDIGANSGIYSLILSNKFSNLNIYAIEPVQKTYQKLLRNIKSNKLENKILSYNCGLSNKDEILKMKTNIKFGYNQSAGYHVSKNGTENAKFIMGDKLIKYKNMNILIKIDTEGHEKFVLEGMSNLIKNNKIFLQIEIWEKNFVAVNKLLKEFNFIYVKKINNDYYFKN